VGIRLGEGRLLVAGLAALSFLALLAWGASPYAQYLDHAHQPSSAGGQVGATVVYVAGWLLMTTAMMLPTATRLVRAFERVTRSRVDAARLRLELIGGFLLVWLGVGYLFRAADILVHAGVDASGWLAGHSALVGAASLALAGAYQFSGLKHRCLTACRSPRSFIFRGWGGGRAHADAVRIGADYGRSCAGCCWALMLVMFGVGTTNVGWMLALAAVMAGERFAPARVQERLGAAIGFALLALAAVIAAQAL
jgi:predicted metal-binding membrane protein